MFDTKSMDALAAKVRASREARGLKSTYVGLDGRPFDMYHPSEAAKAFYDYKHVLKSKYPTEADLPKEERDTLDRLFRAFRPE